VPQRKWLSLNKVDFSQYPDELKFQELNKKYSLVDRARVVRVTRDVNNQIDERVGEMMQRELLEIAKKKNATKLAEAMKVHLKGRVMGMLRISGNDGQAYQT